ncbi:MAG: AAA family ATPase [Chloroflexi bacterium]|nr:AAA family ATPase [Chloroflexota bacterium]
MTDDGSGKADVPKPKMELGPCAGGVAMLATMREDGVLGIAEGIETSLAAGKMFGIPVWAGLSAGGVRFFIFPPGLKQLTIFADKGKDGEKAAWDLYQRALAAGIQAFVVLPKSDDDFAKDLALGYTVKDYLPETVATQQPTPGFKPLELVLFRDMQARIEDRTIVGDLLNEREMSAVVGASGTGKTFLVIDMALHLAGGRTWFDRPTSQRAVIYIAAEAGRGIENRVVAYKKHYPDIPADLPFGAIVSPVNLREDMASNGLYPVLDAIDSKSAELGVPVGLIIVDTLSRAMAGGDENGSADMGAFVGNMDKLREMTGAHVLIVHHLGKDASRGARGHSLFHAAVDTEITVTRDNATGISTATVTKQRELPTMGRINYRMRSVELGRDQNDRPVTSCVVEAADQPDGANGTSKARLGAAPKRALVLLVDAVARHGQTPPADDHIPNKVRCVRESYWRDCCYQGQVSDSENQDSKRKAFKRAAETLVGAGVVGKWGEWVWPVL